MSTDRPADLSRPNRPRPAQGIERDPMDPPRAPQNHGAGPHHLRQFRLSQQENDQFFQLHDYLNNQKHIDTLRYLLTLVPLVLDGSIDKLLKERASDRR